MEILKVTKGGGFILAEQGEIIYCKDAAEVHRELEFIIGVPDLPPPLPPTEKKMSGVRQFDDEE